MPIDPSTLLDLANHLFSNASADRIQQARFRTAINRGYYACLLLVIQKIEAANVPVKARSVGTHSWVRRALKASGRGPLLKIKQRLSSLEESRTGADYVHDSPDFTSTEVQDVLGKASSLFSFIKGGHAWGGIPGIETL